MKVLLALNLAHTHLGDEGAVGQTLRDTPGHFHGSSNPLLAFLDSAIRQNHSARSGPQHTTKERKGGNPQHATKERRGGNPLPDGRRKQLADMAPRLKGLGPE